MLPQDDHILLSYLDLSREELETRLSSLGFRYDETCNQFV